jgi:hypothetical protein
MIKLVYNGYYSIQRVMQNGLHDMLIFMLNYLLRQAKKCIYAIM